MKLPQTGGCQGGKVRYEITEEPQSVYTCHCLDCQRLTSSAFSLGMVIPEKGFRLIGIDHLDFNAPPIADASTPDWFAQSAVPGSAACRGLAGSASEAARWMIHPGCGPRDTYGLVGSRLGGSFPRVMKFSRDSLPDITRRFTTPLVRCSRRPRRAHSTRSSSSSLALSSAPFASC